MLGFARFAGRLDDFDALAGELFAPDMTNAVTERAEHHAAQLGDLMEGFRPVLPEYPARLVGKPEE